MLERNFVSGIMHLVFGFIEIVLALRIVLKLFGASTQAEFVEWIYATSEPLLEPFQGMFPSPELASQFEIEISALFALAIYALIAYIIDQFVFALGQTNHKSKA